MGYIYSGVLAYRSNLLPALLSRISSSGIEVSTSSSLRGRCGGSGEGKPSRPRTVESITDSTELDDIDVADDSWDSSDRLAWRRLEEDDETMLIYVQRGWIVEYGNRKGRGEGGMCG